MKSFSYRTPHRKSVDSIEKNKSQAKITGKGLRHREVEGQMGPERMEEKKVVLFSIATKFLPMVSCTHWQLNCYQIGF